MAWLLTVYGRHPWRQVREASLRAKFGHKLLTLSYRLERQEWLLRHFIRAGQGPGETDGRIYSIDLSTLPRYRSRINTALESRRRIVPATRDTACD